MNTNTNAKVFLMAISLLSCYERACEASYKESDTPTPQEESVTGGYTNDGSTPRFLPETGKNFLAKHYGKITAAVLGIGAFFVAYKKSETVQTVVNDQAHAAKEKIISSVIVPALMKYEEIHDEGVKGKDVGKGVLVGLSCYGAKKAADYLKIKDVLTTGETEKTREAFESFMKNPKYLFGLGGALFIGSRLWNYLSKDHVSHLIDKLSLTPDQQLEILESDEGAHALVGEKDALQLQANASFVSVLTDIQKKLLDQFVDEYELGLFLDDES